MVRAWPGDTTELPIDAVHVPGVPSAWTVTDSGVPAGGGIVGTARPGRNATASVVPAPATTAAATTIETIRAARWRDRRRTTTRSHRSGRTSTGPAVRSNREPISSIGELQSAAKVRPGLRGEASSGGRLHAEDRRRLVRPVSEERRQNQGGALPGRELSKGPHHRLAVLRGVERISGLRPERMATTLER